jgi:hypothetical protein
MLVQVQPSAPLFLKTSINTGFFMLQALIFALAIQAKNYRFNGYFQ